MNNAVLATGRQVVKTEHGTGRRERARAPGLAKSVRSLSTGLCIVLAAFAAGACAGDQKQADDASSAGKLERVPEVESTIQKFNEKDPDFAALFTKSAAYVVLPEVGEGGFIVGGGSGEGEAFVSGQYAGYVKVSALKVGALVGGQTFSQLVFFEKPADFERLKKNEFEFGSEVSAVAANKGVAKNASFEDGVLAFVIPKKGLMASASIGGQKMTFTPAK